ncbi:hypothetical protein [Frankia sp. R82]|uniref:hypothetical protein n=1 Tax=Frankia sp. R82 TaxID=2950553 RepID=UPI002043071A|nr:hypothetical protein [Frankia sp. R82]MCM3884120.1 hypothetical protein [Frankia sp. R82]
MADLCAGCLAYLAAKSRRGDASKAVTMVAGTLLCEADVKLIFERTRRDDRQDFLRKMIGANAWA